MSRRKFIDISCTMEDMQAQSNQNASTQEKPEPTPPTQQTQSTQPPAQSSTTQTPSTPATQQNTQATQESLNNSDTVTLPKGGEEGVIAQAEGQNEAQGTPFDEIIPEDKLMLDIDEGQQTQDIVFAIDDADDAVNDLQKLDTLVGEAEEKGGMDETTAKIVQLTHESIVKRLGYGQDAHAEGIRNPVPSFENYQNARYRLSATVESRNEIQYNIESIVGKLGGMIKNAAESVMNFFKKLIDSARKIYEEATELSKKLQTKGDQPSKPDFEFAPTGIRNKNDITTATGIVDSIEDSMVCINHIVNDLKSAVLDDAWAEKANVVFAKMMTDLGKHHQHGSKLYGTYSKQRAILFDSRKATADVVVYDKSIPVTKAPSGKEIKKILTMLMDQSGWFKDIEKHVGAISDRAIEQVLSKESAQAAKYFSLLIFVFIEVFPKVLVSSMRDLLEYCSKAINNLEAKA